MSVQVEIITKGATADEAAAIVAAVEQFRRDHAPIIVAEGPKLTGWQRAALLEGVGHQPDVDHAWL